MSLPNDTEPLSKREMIAAMAMQSLIGKLCFVHVDGHGDPEQHAKWAVIYADALISELAKETK